MATGASRVSAGVSAVVVAGEGSGKFRTGEVLVGEEGTEVISSSVANGLSIQATLRACHSAI